MSNSTSSRNHEIKYIGAVRVRDRKEIITIPFEEIPRWNYSTGYGNRGVAFVLHKPPIKEIRKDTYDYLIEKGYDIVVFLITYQAKDEADLRNRLRTAIRGIQKNHSDTIELLEYWGANLKGAVVYEIFKAFDFCSLKPDYIPLGLPKDFIDSMFSAEDPTHDKLKKIENEIDGTKSIEDIAIATKIDIHTACNLVSTRNSLWLEILRRDKAEEDYARKKEKDYRDWKVRVKGQKEKEQSSGYVIEEAEQEADRLHLIHRNLTSRGEESDVYSSVYSVIKKKSAKFYMRLDEVISLIETIGRPSYDIETSHVIIEDILSWFFNDSPQFPSIGEISDFGNRLSTISDIELCCVWHQTVGNHILQTLNHDMSVEEKKSMIYKKYHSLIQNLEKQHWKEKTSYNIDSIDVLRKQKSATIEKVLEYFKKYFYMNRYAVEFADISTLCVVTGDLTLKGIINENFQKWSSLNEQDYEKELRNWLHNSLRMENHKLVTGKLQGDESLAN
ncbi:MAG: hypothetical protein ACXAEF_16500, partial [Candidatus Thorarchaeota archaeon]